MLLFLMGVDIPTLLVIFLLLFLFGLLTFRIARRLFRRIMKGTSENKINLLSRVFAFILAPIIVIGGLALFIYVSIQTAPKESEEEMVHNHYQMMEEDIAKDLRIGMSKGDVTELLGESDTTQSVMTYDLSLPEAREKYLLEIKFNNGALTSFERKR